MFISYRAPHPITSGDKIRIYQNLEFLTDKNQVDIYYLNENKLKSNVSLSNNIFEFKKSKFKSLFDSFYYAFFRGWPMQVGFFYSKKLHEMVSLNYKKYDSIFLNNIRTYPYIEKIIKLKHIHLDLVDSNLLNLENKIRTSRFLTKFMYKFEYKLMKKYQDKVFKRNIKLIVISKRDKDHIDRDYIKANVGICPNYVRNLEIQQSNFSKNIAFMGKLSYEPNVKAINFFVKEIFPFIQKKIPNVQLNIIGGSFNKKYYRNILEHEGVNFLGFVDDLKSFVNTQRLFVAPMISGSGLQNKVIEAMGFGKIVLGTKIASDGMYGSPILTKFFFDDKSQFINELIYFLDDSRNHLIDENSKLVHNYILTHYSKEVVKSQFNSIVKY